MKTCRQGSPPENERHIRASFSDGREREGDKAGTASTGGKHGLDVTTQIGSHPGIMETHRVQSHILRAPISAGNVASIEIERGFVPAEYPSAAPSLKARDLAIIRLLIADKSCKEAAAQLGLTVRAVEHVVERLKLQLHKSTLHGLIAYLVTALICG